jgi:hypothetical protein
VAVSVVEFKNGPRLVTHQQPASGVRVIPVTPDLNNHYVALLANENTDCAVPASDGQFSWGAVVAPVR